MSPQYPQGHVFYRNLHHSYPLIESGKGIYLHDIEGKQYMDASGGAAVVNIGHGVKEVTEAITSQAYKIGYLNGLQFTPPKYMSLQGYIYFQGLVVSLIRASTKPFSVISSALRASQ